MFMVKPSLLLAPTFAPETDDAATGAEVNITTCSDEETGSLLLGPSFATALEQ